MIHERCEYVNNRELGLMQPGTMLFDDSGITSTNDGDDDIELGTAARALLPSILRFRRS